MDTAVSESPKPRVTLESFHELVRDGAPFMEDYGLQAREIGYGTARGYLPYSSRFVRPGGTISGPTMFGLADFTLWLAVLGAYGEVPLAVTTNMSINFLRKPAEAGLIADARLLKTGKRLAVGDVMVYSEGALDPCAHVSGTYSVPPDRSL